MIPTTQEEADKLNAQTKAELEAEFKEDAEQKQAVVNSGLRHLLDVVQAETIDVKFNTSGGEAVLKIKANPTQKELHDLARISKNAMEGIEEMAGDEDRFCHILESLCVDPPIPFDVWKSGEVPDEIPAYMVIELGKHKEIKQIEMEEDVSSFRENYRRAKTARNVPASEKNTE